MAQLTDQMFVERRDIAVSSFWATVTSNGSSYATGPLSVLYVSL